MLPTLYLLGIVTFVRLVECGAEDFRYGLAINRIRHYYKEVAGDRADLLLLSGHDDGEGVFANMGLPAEGRKPFSPSRAPSSLSTAWSAGARPRLPLVPSSALRSVSPSGSASRQ